MPLTDIMENGRWVSESSWCRFQNTGPALMVRLRIPPTTKAQIVCGVSLWHTFSWMWLCRGRRCTVRDWYISPSISPPCTLLSKPWAYYPSAIQPRGRRIFILRMDFCARLSAASRCRPTASIQPIAVPEVFRTLAKFIVPYSLYLCKDVTHQSFCRCFVGKTGRMSRPTRDAHPHVHCTRMTSALRTRFLGINFSKRAECCALHSLVVRLLHSVLWARSSQKSTCPIETSRLFQPHFVGRARCAANLPLWSPVSVLDIFIFTGMRIPTTSQLFSSGQRTLWPRAVMRGRPCPLPATTLLLSFIQRCRRLADLDECNFPSGSAFCPRPSSRRRRNNDLSCFYIGKHNLFFNKCGRIHTELLSYDLPDMNKY